MRFFWILLFLISLIGCHSPRTKPAGQVKAFMIQQADSIGLYAKAMQTAVDQQQWSLLPGQFAQARHHYKQGEGLYEFYFGGICDFLNGPAIDEEEEYDMKVVEATGFQVLEEMLFPEVDTAQRARLESEVKMLHSASLRLRRLCEDNILTDESIFKALRLQLMRVMSLGITGFDSPVALHSLSEAVSSLDGIARVVSLYEVNPTVQSAWTEAITRARAHLAEHRDFDSFDRAAFIRKSWRRATQALLAVERSLDLPKDSLVWAVDLSYASFLDSGSLNINHFVPGYNRNASPLAVDLGEKLFFDPILSGTGTRSCASCHQPQRAFTDGLAKSETLLHARTVLRNAPTLINSGFQKTQFWDSRVHFLEDQIADVVSNPEEMQGDLKITAERLQGQSTYRSLFEKAYPGQAIGERTVLAALAAYIRSLNGFNAPVDRYLRGDTTQLNDDEIAGLNLFMGKAKCATCHFMPLTNGTLPPLYLKSESEVLGVATRADTAHATVDPDLGKYGTYHRELHRHMFKTPTLRNIALTAPYMHNGAYATLEDVIQFYNKGGGAGIGIELPNQTLPPDPLQLSQHEQRQLKAFMLALTDTTGLMPRHAHQ